MSQPRVNGRRRSRALAITVLAAVALSATALAPPAAATLPPAPSPALNRTLRTNPFPASDISARDHEGSAHVPGDNSLWLADDDGRSIYEVNPQTGALKRRIRGSQFAAVLELGGGPRATTARTDDIQALAYDTDKDVLYVFSGRCCVPGLLPTVFRLTRSAGRLELDSYQPLAVADVAAAGWNPGDGKLYIGADSTIQTYTWAGNTVGSGFGIAGVSSIYGLDFTDDGRDLFVARPPATITRVDWASRTKVAGWELDLAPYGVLDSRAVELLGDQLWVSDGFDFRPPGDPLSHALFVLDVGGSTPPPGGPGTPGAPGTPGGPTASKNLVGNSGFERGLRGWGDTAAGARLTRVKGGHSGSWAARVKRTGAKGTIGLTDAPDWVGKSSDGTYSGSLWVRSSKPGDVLKLRLRELKGKNTVGQSTARVTLTKKWQRVTVTLPSKAPGRSSIDLTATVKRAAKGTSFDADDARLTVS